MSATSLPTKRLTVYTPELSVIVGGFRPVYLNTSTGETKEGDIIDIPLSTMLDYELKLDFNFDKVNLEIEGEWAAYMQAQLGSNNYYYNQSIGLKYITVSEFYNSSTYYLNVFNGPTQSNSLANVWFLNNRSRIGSSLRIDITDWTIQLSNIEIADDSFGKYRAAGGETAMFRYPIAVYQKVSDEGAIPNLTNGLSTSWFFISNYTDSGYATWYYNPSSNLAEGHFSSDMTEKFHLIYSGPDYIGKTSPTKISYINVESVPTYDIVLATDDITKKYIFSDEYCDKYIYNIDPTSNYKYPGSYDIRENWDILINGLIPKGPSCIFPITAQAVANKAPIQRFVHPHYIKNTQIISLTTKYRISTIDIGIISVPTTTNYYFAITTAALTQINEDTVYNVSETVLSSAIYMNNIKTERMIDSNGIERWVSHVIFSLEDLEDRPYGEEIGLASSNGKLYLHLDGEYRMSTYPT